MSQQPKSLLELQQELHYETYKRLLEDLQNSDKRTPALIQAALKALQQSGMQLDPSAVPVEGSSGAQMARIAAVLPPLLADDEEFDQ